MTEEELEREVARTICETAWTKDGCNERDWKFWEKEARAVLSRLKELKMLKSL